VSPCEFYGAAVVHHQRPVDRSANLALPHSDVFPSSGRPPQGPTAEIFVAALLLRPPAKVQFCEMGESCVLVDLFSVVGRSKVSASEAVGLVEPISLEKLLLAGHASGADVEGQFFFSAGDDALSIRLLPIVPKPFILYFSLRVVKLPVAVAIVVVEIALILPSVVPGVHAVACFFVTAVVAAVVFDAIAMGEPHSVPAAIALLKVSFVVAAICPAILAEALRHSVGVLANVVIAVAIVLLSLAVLQSVLERTREKVAGYFLVDAAAVGQSSPPLSLVVFHELVGFGVSGGEAKPVEGASAVLLVIEEVADIEVPIRVYLHA